MQRRVCVAMIRGAYNKGGEDFIESVDLLEGLKMRVKVSVEKAWQLWKSPIRGGGGRQRRDIRKVRADLRSTKGPGICKGGLNVNTRANHISERGSIGESMCCIMARS